MLIPWTLLLVTLAGCDPSTEGHSSCQEDLSIKPFLFWAQ